MNLREHLAEIGTDLILSDTKTVTSVDQNSIMASEKLIQNEIKNKFKEEKESMIKKNAIIKLDSSRGKSPLTLRCPSKEHDTTVKTEDVLQEAFKKIPIDPNDFKYRS